MITNEDILNMNFYKKERFTGSYRGMRYLIRKASVREDDADASGDVPQRDVFRATLLLSFHTGGKAAGRRLAQRPVGEPQG